MITVLSLFFIVFHCYGGAVMSVKKPAYRPVDAMLYPRFSGIRTFMRLPQITDLTDVDFAIVGVPFDTGGTYRVGARFGPEGIRSQSMLLRPFNPALNVLSSTTVPAWITAIFP